MVDLYLTHFVNSLNKRVESFFAEVLDLGFLGFIILDFFVLCFVYKVLMGRQRSMKGLKGRVLDSELIEDIEKSFKEIPELVDGNKPKVPGVNYAEINVMKKVDSLMENAKEMQEMCSAFQAGVIEAHIEAFRVLQGDQSKCFLQPPEKELVEPDSALPPLDESEGELI